MDNTRLLVIDDDTTVLDAIRRMAERLGYDVKTVDSARDFMATLETFRPNYLMIDVVMPETDGVELLKLLAKRGSDARIIMMTGYRQSYLAKAIEMGRGLGLSAIAGVIKPLGFGDVKRALSKAASGEMDPSAQREPVAGREVATGAV